MNHDEKNPDLQPWIEPELEARIVAAVLGEASAFETAELERLASEKPELAIFKRRIEAVHGLIGAAARPEQVPLRLAPERRAKILQTIGSAAARPPGADTNVPVLVQLATARRKRRKKWIWASGLAASVMFAAILAVKVLPEMENTLRPARPEPSQTVLGPTAAKGVSERQARVVDYNPGPTDTVRLDPFQVEKKPSIVSSLRKALTTSPESSDARSSNKEIAQLRTNNGNDFLAADGKLQAEEAKGKFYYEAARKREETGIVTAQMKAARDQERMWSAESAAAGRPGGRSQFGLDGAAAGNEYQHTFGGKVGAASSKIVDVPAGRTDTLAFHDKTSPAPAAVVPVGSTFRPLPEADAVSERYVGSGNANVAKVVTAADAFGAIREDNTADFNKPLLAAKNKPAAAPVRGLAGTNERTKVATEDSLVLSPFMVDAAKDRGYASAQTLSGTRLNSKLEDLASSITVVTKQSLADKAALDINDTFKTDNFLSTSETKPVMFERFVGGLAMQPEPPTDAPSASAAAEDERLSQQKAPSPAPPPAEPSAESARAEISAAKESVSTFSLHVSDVSFRLAQAALARGELPDPARIRPEEFYNAFDYGDPAPAVADKISCRIEQSAHPLLQQRNFVRIAMKVPAAGRGAGQPLHLTVLLDTSGSMEREDRIASVHRALEVLASLLGANDRVTLIGFSRQPRLLVEQLPGNEAAQLVKLAADTPFTGGTNLEEALKLAGELACRHHDAAAQNRIVLLTDGAANLGNADPAQLAKMIEALRQQGVAFDACGVGTDGLDDAILEALTRKGDGRYYVIDKPEDADAGFARQLAGAFRPAAENVKVQVRFNPARVARYRLIGFEQHRLREEDFRNDRVDAAELAAEEAAVALYQVEVLPQGEGELGEVFVRFRDTATSNMVERSWTILHEPQARAFDRATPTIQLAGTAALLAEKLRGGEPAAAIQLGELAPVVNALRGHYANNTRVQELVTMFEQVRRKEGK